MRVNLAPPVHSGRSDVRGRPRRTARARTGDHRTHWYVRTCTREASDRGDGPWIEMAKKTFCFDRERLLLATQVQTAMSDENPSESPEIAIFGPFADERVCQRCGHLLRTHPGNRRCEAPGCSCRWFTSRGYSPINDAARRQRALARRAHQLNMAIQRAKAAAAAA